LLKSGFEQFCTTFKRLKTPFRNGSVCGEGQQMIWPLPRK